MNEPGWSAEQVRAQVKDFNVLADYLNRIADALGCDNPQIIERVTELLDNAKRLRELLKERHEFPEYPSPGEGLVSNEEDWQAQQDWREKWTDINERIRKASA